MKEKIESKEYFVPPISAYFSEVCVGITYMFAFAFIWVLAVILLVRLWGWLA